jgi:hypothetical protein
MNPESQEDFEMKLRKNQRDRNVVREVSKLEAVQSDIPLRVNSKWKTVSNKLIIK